MRSFAGFLILMGAGSMVLHLVHFDFILMSWVDSWGEPTGWVIRGVVLALGLALAACSGCAKSQGAPPAPPAPPA